MAATQEVGGGGVVQCRSIRFVALDGFELGGSVFETSADHDNRTVAILAGGGGVLAQRYRRFAEYLAKFGVPTLTFDYRGIGASRLGPLRGFKASARDWARNDIGGAIAEMSDKYPASSLAAISHSIGGMLLGAAPNISRVQIFVFVCPHTAYWGDYRYVWRLPMLLLWHGIMPVVTLLHGYFPARIMRLGEDIPREVALEWAKRLQPSLPAHFLNEETRGYFSSAHGRALAITIADDGFAQSKGASRLLSLFPNISPIWEVVGPSDLRVQKLGHFGFFRSARSKDLWPRVASFLNCKATNNLPG